MRETRTTRDMMSIISMPDQQPWNSQNSIEIVVNRSTVWIAAAHVDRGIRRQVFGDGMVADADLELWKWKDPVRGALY